MAYSTIGHATPLSDAEIERRVAEIDDQGYTLLEGVIDPELIGALRDTVTRLLAELDIPFGENTFLGHNTRRIFNLLPRDPIFAQVPLHATVLPLIDRVLGGQCLLSSLTAIEMSPGQRPQPFHADDGSITLPRPHIALECIGIWALTDFNKSNGGTRIVPGSHKWDRAPVPGERVDYVTVEMPAGSVVVYHGSLWHGGGANDTDERRMGIVVNHCAGFMRQEENQLLAIPREVAAEFPRRLQELIGYGVFRGLMGHVEKQDPGVLLDPNVESKMIWRKMQ
ncbi:MAG: phytanoyl-CoA dioxygenase family protein [Acidimicrobiales bacterium]